ncbi:MAG: HD domain-containing phosphohydrolase [bacterium]
MKFSKLFKKTAKSGDSEKPAPAREAGLASEGGTPPEQAGRAASGTPRFPGGPGRPRTADRGISQQNTDKSEGEIRSRPRRPPQEKQSGEDREKQQSEANAVYGESISVVRELLNSVNDSGLHGYSRFSVISEKIQSLLEKGNEQILAATFHATGGNYLYAHSVNTAILALQMGRSLKLSSDEQRFLGCCGFFHDMGMTGFMQLASKESRLSEDEYVDIKRHSDMGARLSDNIQDMDVETAGRLKLVISQVHERFDGSGYPHGLRGASMDPLAQMLAAADVFEALTHPRSWRKALTPHKAVKFLMNRKGTEFPVQTVKMFLETFSMYPPGSYVKLTTGEIARVVGVNPGMLTRPELEIVLDASGRPVSRQYLNLPDHPLSHITDAIDLTGEHIPDRAILMQMESSRWWVDW